MRKHETRANAYKRAAIVTAILMCPTGAEMATSGGPASLTIIGAVWVLASLAVMLYWIYER